MGEAPVAPVDVHATLSRHLLALGHSFVLDLERSTGPFIRDAKSDQEFLDFASFYASTIRKLEPHGLVTYAANVVDQRAPPNCDFTAVNTYDGWYYGQYDGFSRKPPFLS